MAIIFERPSVNIILDDSSKMFEVNIKKDEKYNEPGFLEFIDYFKSSWEYICDKNDIYFMAINIEAEGENDLPLSAFITLISTLTDLNKIFCKHLHSCCIISSGAKKWQDTYDLITKLYKPKDQRPLKFTGNKEESKLFLISNKIIT
jgi:hypothetical protein